MVAAMLATLLERGLDSGPTNQPQYSHDKAVILRVVTTVCACISMLADCLALAWFMQMKRKFRHSLIMCLILADLVKDLNWIIFSIVTFVRGTVATASGYCQASGFIAHAAIEVTDLSVLIIVIHMSLQILNPTFAAARLDRFRHTILTFICLLAVVMSALPFANPDEGYRLAGAFCVLPVRPLWYRLALDWIERYIIAIVIVVLTIVIRYKVKAFQQTLARLQAHDLAGRQNGVEADIIEESDEADSGLGHEDPSEKEKEAEQPEPEKPTVDEIETVPDDEHNQFRSDDLQKFKRQSYRVRRQTNAFENQPRVISMAASAAPSSAIFSPYRDSFRIGDPPQTPDHEQNVRSASVIDVPARRQSVAAFGTPMRGMSVMDMPRRRASLVETQGINPIPATARSSMFNGSTVDARPGDRSSVLLAPPARRSSIWDEIDASLDKKFTNNRISMLSMTPSQTDVSTRPISAAPPTSAKRASVINPLAANPTPAAPSTPDNKPATKLMNRSSRVYDRAKRTLSIMSRAGGDAPEDADAPDSAAAILARRHRYIQRQMRYLILYPVVYLSLWLCPFLLHCLQYSDKFARSPPYAVVVLTYISICSFGFANSLIFCLREKPWTLIQDSDGTVWGSLRPGFVLWKLGLGQKIGANEDTSWVA